MSHKIEFRKIFYNLVGQMPKSTIGNMLQGPNVSHITICKVMREEGGRCFAGICKIFKRSSYHSPLKSEMFA